MYARCLFVLLSASLVAGQRPSFAGTNPIGFPTLTDALPKDPLQNKFGEELELPIEAKGDRDLVERISKMPVDKQPFWYINWKALEAQRKNPQTYPQKPNVFSGQASSGDVSQNNGLTSKFGESVSNQNTQSPNFDYQYQGQNQNYNNYRNSGRHY